MNIVIILHKFYLIAHSFSESINVWHTLLLQHRFVISSEISKINDI